MCHRYTLLPFPRTKQTRHTARTASLSFPYDAGYTERAETKNEADEDMQWDHRESGKYTKKARAATADISSKPFVGLSAHALLQLKSSTLRS